MIRRVISLSLIIFILLPQAVFAFDENHCSCQSSSAVETPTTDEILIPVYFFADENGGIFGISPVTDDLFVWAYSYSPETAETVQALNYTYDSVGNITKIEDYSSTTAKIVNFGYDALYRLATASTTNASTSPNYFQTWGYNAIVNISTTSAIGDYQYDGHAGSLYANPHAVTSIGSMTLSYDKNGNLGTTTQGTTQWLYNWDYKNQLTQAASGTATSTFDYDHGGSRVKMAVNGLATTTYVNKNYNIQGATTTKHIYAGNELVAEVIGNGNSTSTYIIHTDHLGGVHVVTNASGTAVSTSDFYPYGDLRINSGSLNEQRRYTGHEYDSVPNLSYMGTRYYNGTRGQFLSQDSEFWDSVENYIEDPQQMNSYSYARNNPINAKDPDGKAVALVLTPPVPTVLIGVISALLATLSSITVSNPQTQSAISQIVNTTQQVVQSVNSFVNSSAVKVQSRLVSVTPIAMITIGSQTAVSTPTTNIPGLSIPGYSDRGTALFLQNTAGSKGRSLPTPGQLTGKSAEEVDQLMKEKGIKGEPSRGGGTRYPVPGRPGDQVRIEKGNPNNPDPVKRGPYGRVSENGKKSDPFPLRGNPIPK